MTVEYEVAQPEIATGYLYQIQWKDEYETGEAPLRYCDWGTSLEYDGDTYTPAKIECSDITEKTDGSNTDVNLVIGNLDRTMQALVEDYDMVGREVKQVQWFNNTTKVRIYYWIITGVSTTEKEANFTLGTNIDFLKAELPNRKMHAGLCAWQFKDNACKYSGTDTSCEMTWEDCRARGNTLNFGGAPGLVSSHFFF